ncbi:MAG: hypothetical protein K2X93_02230 [Candidatus Obscuribacterales bacterium]|nr:hypothetical protein [Candidatus Obscuribacterales bacterium]
MLVSIMVCTTSGTILAQTKEPVAASRNPLRFELKTAASKESYSFVYLNDAIVRFVLVRPKKNDPRVLMSIPAAFTTLDGKVDGVYVKDGAVHGSVNTRLGGALKIINGQFEVLDTKSGAALNDDFLQTLASNKASLFQEFQVIKDNLASTFKDKSKFQRRGIGKLRDGRPVIVESKTAITLSMFAKDASELGVKELLYTDMGAWSEGWVRDPKSGQLVTIGADRQATSKQSNWLILIAPQK